MPSWPDDPNRFSIRIGCDGDLVLFINGIMTMPGDQFAWTDRAERWVGRNTRHEFDSVEYFHTPVLGPILGDRGVYEEALELLRGYTAAWTRTVQTSGRGPLRLHLVAHSHGSEIVRRLVLESGYRFETAHLFAPAIGADLEKNGLNRALQENRLDELALYVSKGDGVLRWLPPLSLGLYGQLGYKGPQNIRPEVRARVKVYERKDLGHSEWFGPAEFEQSMRLVEFGIDRIPF